MLFLKVFDQREEEWEADNAAYVSPIPERFRWRNWAAYKIDAQGKKKSQISGSDLIPFVAEMFSTLKEDVDGSIDPQHLVIKRVFEDANNYMKSGALMLLVIEKLEDVIDFHDFKTRSNLGDVYEQMLNDLRGAGNAGEFYTPRAITTMMVAQVNPSLAKRETVLDPACGTGGFLTAAIDHFRNQITPKLKANERRTIEQLIRGIEKKQLPHLLCTTNMLLHGIDVPSQIEHRNTLSRPWDDWHPNEMADCLVTNPPFGGYEDDGVGADFPSELRTRETADMFITLIIKKLLKKGGRAAVVLPDGFLFGDGVKSHLKRLLLRECKLHTVVRLPKGVFAPYTMIKTNLLFFTKGTATDGSTECFHTDTIWFYEHQYPTGYKSYSKTKPIQLEEFKPLQGWWGREDNDFADRQPTKLAFKVNFKAMREAAEVAAKPHWQRAEALNNETSAFENEARTLRTSLARTPNDPSRQQIERDIAALRDQAETRRLQARDAQAAGDRLYWPIFNLDLKHPNAIEEESADPDVLLENYAKLLGEIAEVENRLKSELGAALAHHVAGEHA